MSDWNKTLPANLQRVERDHIPTQVATEMLCRGGAMMANKDRKLYMRARENHYESTRQPKGNRRQEILAKRLRQRPWTFLVSRNRRCINVRAEVQQAYVIGNRHLTKLKEKTGKPDPREVLAILMLERQLAALEVKAKELDMAWECITDEMERREKLIKLCQQQKNATY